MQKVVGHLRLQTLYSDQMSKQILPVHSKLSLLAVLRAKCPRCRVGKVTQGLFGIVPRCANCDYNFYPESGFYLGALVVGFFLAAVLTIPPLIALKVADVEIELLAVFPFVEFLFLGPFLMVYSKVFWLHLEYVMSRRLG